MAGDWIPIRDDILNVREVVTIASLTGMDKYQVVGHLVAFWGWVSRQTADGILVDVNLSTLVDALNVSENFFLVLVQVGWLKISGKNIEVPNFHNWFSGSAKARLQKNNRQQRWRNRVRKAVDGSVDGDASLLFSSVIDKDLNINNSLKEHLKDWIDYRDEIKKPVSCTAIRRIVKKWNNQPELFGRLIDRAIQNGWQGFDFPERGGNGGRGDRHQDATEHNLALVHEMELEVPK